MHIARVNSPHLLKECRKFLAADPATNVLPLGDLYHPILRLSNAYAAIDKRRLLGVCTVFHGFSAPSLVFSAETLETKKALIMEGLNEVSSEYGTICTQEEARLFEEEVVCDSHLEYQMVALHFKPSEKVPHVKAERVARSELDELERFYEAQGAHAWIKVQFESGPYYCVKDQGRIVSAAGVHIVAPQVAQLGNIFTNESYRRRGYGLVCTARVASHLARTGRIISLFVLADNAPAIRMYEKLGFVKKRSVLLMMLKKRPERF